MVGRIRTSIGTRFSTLVHHRRQRKILLQGQIGNYFPLRTGQILMDPKS